MMQEPNRLSWNEYFLRIAKLTAQRSTCPRASVGAVLVQDRRIIATGYNGAPLGVDHCEDAGCAVDKDNHCTRAVHAEVNALLQAGKSSQGSHLYLTHNPCYACAKILINAGIQKIFFEKFYTDSLLPTVNSMPGQIEFLRQANIETIRIL